VRSRRSGSCGRGVIASCVSSFVLTVAVAAVANHHWFGLLARCYPGKALGDVLTKTLLHHGTYNPIGYLPLFYAFNGKNSHQHANAPTHCVRTLTGVWMGRTGSEIVEKVHVSRCFTLQRFNASCCP
jgi:hypothetical protein